MLSPTRAFLLCLFAIAACHDPSSSDLPVHIQPSAEPEALPSLTVETLPSGADAPVLRVIDGDTIQVELDGHPERVRYIGIDTPEIGRRGKVSQPFAEAALRRNRELVEGRTVRLVLDVQHRDRYGRLLAYVFSSDGTFVNARLLAEGFARVLTIPPNVRHASALLLIEQEARLSRRGLWSR